MSRHDVDTVRQMVQAFNRGDVDGMLRLSDPEIEINDIPEMPESRVFRGRDGLREFLRLNREPWESVTFEIEQVVDLDGKVLVLGRNRARGQRSGVATDQPRGVIVSMREGKVASLRAYAAPAEALEAAGLSREQAQS
jgi:ketosteroid isomerase-like protein